MDAPILVEKYMMKITFVVTALIISNLSFCQTTLEEYNYVTKGYRAQIESGLDMKKGYELADITTAVSYEDNGSERKAWLKALSKIRIDGGRKVVAYMIIYQKAGDTKEYLCIPHPNSDKQILNLYFNALYPNPKENHAERLRLLTYLLSKGVPWV